MRWVATIVSPSHFGRLTYCRDVAGLRTDVGFDILRLAILATCVRNVFVSVSVGLERSDGHASTRAQLSHGVLLLQAEHIQLHKHLI